MVGGDGLRIAAGLVGMALMCAGLVLALDWFERHWREFAGAPRDDQPPTYRGRCRCAACRLRPNTPCSDFDEV